MRVIVDKEKRLGEINYNNHKEKMTIIEYNSATDITVQFEDNHDINTTYSSFKKGNIKNPYRKAIFEIGYVGQGNYKTKINKKHTPQYLVWRTMIMRCYSPKYSLLHPTYIDCNVTPEWHNYQNFAKWYDENYYDIEDQVMNLDKDILIKNNIVYSPDTCIFVPQNINKLFTKRQNDRGLYPIGVTLHKKTNKYRASYNDINSKTTYLGIYNTPEKAFEIYKGYKEKLIKEIAEQYKDKIPQKLYNALYRYEVEITD